jgi:NADP-dependent 3-hydroxy acid dehydrogenase YdfG
MKQLEGKVALVTGGGSGIGLAVAKAFLDAGAKVAIAGRNLAKLEAGAKLLAGGSRLVAIAADVTDPVQVKSLVEQVIKQLGPIDLLVNNAGMNIKERTFRELTPAVWDQMIRVNLDGAFYCTQAVFTGMAERKDGHIINIVSVAGKRANPLGGIAYVAAKFGMGSMGIALAAEEKDSGVRVCNIYPGEVDTPILEHRPTPISEEHRLKILKPEDVAASVLFVATLPPHVSIPELVIKPTAQLYV